MSEIEVLATIDAALSSLTDLDARLRVLSWAVAKYGPISGVQRSTRPSDLESVARASDGGVLAPRGSIHPLAQQWLKRNGIAADDRLAAVVSFDHAEIDITVDDLPDATAKARMRSVFLLRGIAAYLATGEWRFDDGNARRTCRHYNAYDPSNFSSYLRDLSIEVIGDKETGYSLTARGQKAAAELLRTLVAQSPPPVPEAAVW